MGGPFTEYKRFEDWILRKGDFATILPGQTLMPALKRFSTGFVCIGLRDVIVLFIQPEYTLTLEFQSHSFLYKAGDNILTIW